MDVHGVLGGCTFVCGRGTVLLPVLCKHDEVRRHVGLCNCNQASPAADAGCSTATSFSSISPLSLCPRPSHTPTHTQHTYLWSQCDLHCVCQLVDTRQHCLPALNAKPHILRCIATHSLKQGSLHAANSDNNKQGVIVHHQWMLVSAGMGPAAAAMHKAGCSHCLANAVDCMAGGSQVQGLLM